MTDHGNKDTDITQEDGSRDGRLLALEERLRDHKYRIKHLEFEKVTTRERLTLLGLNMMFSLIGAATAGYIAAFGFGLISWSEMVVGIEQIVVQFIALCGVFVCLVTVVTWSFDSLNLLYKIIHPQKDPIEDAPKMEE
jgi:hypothetical protein